MDFHFNSIPPLSLYIHLPWCIRKCPYCDFNSHAINQGFPEKTYTQSLLTDIRNERFRVGDRIIESIFFGGGTPSLFSPESIAQILETINASFRLRANLEITLEVNPGTIDQAKLVKFREIGINRLSLGVQSFNERLLNNLGRIHTAKESKQAITLLRSAGFDNFNVDLMYGLPGQTRDMCMLDLYTAVEYEPSHISYYQLTIEPHTQFYACPPILPTEKTQWGMQELGKHIFYNHGYTQYEVSAFSRPNSRCKHNLNYWTFGDYLGIGAGAHGKWTRTDQHKIYRSSKPKQPKQYMTSIQHRLENNRELTAPDTVFEFMLNALRLYDKFSLDLFEERTGLPSESLTTQLNEAIEKGFVKLENRYISTSELGKRFLDDLIVLFLPNDNV